MKGRGDEGRGHVGTKRGHVLPEKEEEGGGADVGGRGAVGSVGKWRGGVEVGAAGGGTECRRVSKEERVSMEGPPALWRNVKSLKSKTETQPPRHTYISYWISWDMPVREGLGGGCDKTR